MFHSAKCPKCDWTLSSIKMEPVDLSVSISEKYKGVSYSCPSCHAVFAAEIDPLALKADLVSSLLSALRKG